MKPTIDKTTFGSITISGTMYEHDVVIRLNGDVKKRKKKLSKAIYGTSPTISLDEAKHIYDKGAEKLIIGNGHTGVLELSKKAEKYFINKNCDVLLMPTPEAITAYNEAAGNVIGMFHVTC